MFNCYHPVPKAAQNFRNSGSFYLTWQLSLLPDRVVYTFHISYYISLWTVEQSMGNILHVCFLITKFAKTSDPLLIKKHYNIKLKTQRFLKVQTALHSSKHENFFKSTINSQTFPVSLIKPTDVCRELCYCRNIVPTPSLLVLHIQS